MINYDDTVKIPLDVLRAASAPLTLPAPATPSQSRQGTSAPSQGQLDQLLCRESTFSMQWWLFVALFVWLVIPIGVELLYLFH